MAASRDKIIDMLETVRAGEPRSADELLPVVYQELRHLAAQCMARQAPGQTLQATALVHEAYLKLARSGRQLWKDEHHFFATAAQAMRQVLIDRARHKASARHHAPPRQADFTLPDLATDTSDDRLLEVDEVINDLAREFPEEGEVVKLRYFVGLTHQEIAAVMDLSERTVKRHWAFARTWIFQRLQREGGAK